jgi:NTP pyrophosphatase (non-canonical NTP hydrolase)
MQPDYLCSYGRRKVLDKAWLPGRSPPRLGVILWNMDIRSSQELAWENKVDKGFNTTNVPLEFCLLQGELAEAFDAWHKDRADLGEELADVAICLLGLAEMTGVNLQREIEAKLAKNAARVYQRLPNDTLAKTSGESD